MSIHDYARPGADISASPASRQTGRYRTGAPDEFSSPATATEAEGSSPSGYAATALRRCRRLRLTAGLVVPFATLFAAPAHAQTETPLTASFVSVPAEHRGDGTKFTLNLLFSEPVVATDERMRTHVIKVENGLLGDLKRTNGRADYWYLKVWPDSQLPVTISLASATTCGAQDVICTTDNRPLSQPASATINGPETLTETPLTASFETVYVEHEGNDRASVRVKLLFSEPVRGTHDRMYKRVIKVANGRLRELRRIDRRKDYWVLWVRPDSHLSLTISLKSAAACGARDVICTDDRRPLSAPASLTIMGPPELSVADAEVQEGPDAKLDFVVTMGRSRQHEVQVHYMTSAGTATEDEDYTRGYGKLIFAAGETSNTVSVAVLEDMYNEGAETLTLRLYQPFGAWLKDGEAVGTITN